MISSPGLAERLAATDERIAEAAREAGRDPASLTRIVVTKFHPAELVRELVALGVRDFGENRHQEAAQKARELAELPVRWHFVGQLQSNKARAVRRYASSVHSVDRLSLLEALASDDDSARAQPLECFLELDLSGEPGRGGVTGDQLMSLAERALATPGIRLVGLMAVAPLGAEPRPAFVRLRAASERLRTLAPEATAISAGMSTDFREAILEGATHLRIGSAITGNRPARA